MEHMINSRRGHAQRIDAALDEDAEIDRLLATHLPSPLPILSVDSDTGDLPYLSGAEPVRIGAPTLATVGGTYLKEEDDATPMFTAMEAELLLASLEDEGETESMAMRPTTASVLPTADATEKKKAKVPSRKRQQQEMEYLRTQVAELETALDQIKEVQHRSEDSGGNTVVSSTPTDALWEQIAMRQLEEKRRSEIENIKLRTLLEGQLRVAHSLEKLLTKRSLTETETVFDPSKRPRISELLTSSADGVFVPDLARRMAEINDVMDACGLTNVEEEIDECHVKTDEKNQIFLERTMTKLLPFPLDRAGDAAWKRMTSARLDLSTGYYGTTRRSERDYDVEFSVECSVRRASAQCMGKGAGCRERTPGTRDVIVWQIHADLKGQAITDHSVGMSDFGYLVVEPLKSTSDGSSCILKVCVRIWPQLAGAELEKTGLFVDLLLSSFNQNTKTILQMIENDLIEQSLCTPSQPAVATGSCSG